MSAVAVIIVSYYSEDDALECVVSLREASASELDICVVNNAPDDPLTRLRSQPGVRIIDSPRNMGYGGAVNYALRDMPASVEWILVSNPDTRFEPGSIDVLLDTGRRTPDAGTLGPRVLNEDGTVYPSARDIPSLTAGTGHALFSKLWPANPWSARYRRADKSQGVQGEPVAAGWLSGSCLLVRRVAFESVHGFDDRFFMYFEDVDLGERIGLAGYRNLYVPSARVTHIGGTSTRRRSHTMLRVHHESAYRYLAKRYHHWYQAPLRWALYVGITAHDRLTNRPNAHASLRDGGERVS